MSKIYACDELGYCPYAANGPNDCMNRCGLGRDDEAIDIEWYGEPEDTSNMCLEEAVLRRLL